MNFSAVDKTVLTPQGRQEMKGVASPIKFTEALQNGDALKVNPQGGALMEALGFGPERVEEKDPDFYMPDWQGKKLSETYQMFTGRKSRHYSETFQSGGKVWNSFLSNGQEVWTPVCPK